MYSRDEVRREEQEEEKIVASFRPAVRGQYFRAMDSDSDDLYDPSDSVPTGVQHKPENAEAKMEDVDEGEEEGEEIEEDDSDDVSNLSEWCSNVLVNQAPGRYQFHYGPKRRAEK